MNFVGLKTCTTVKKNIWHLIQTILREIKKPFDIIKSLLECFFSMKMSRKMKISKEKKRIISIEFLS